ncbi:hypothetical protein V6L77_24125 [Pannonibacter sp. Pt2-lr]
MISQTSGHGDFRLRTDLPRSPQTNLSAAEEAGISAIADGEAEVLRRVREQLMLGASQIKIMGGGGVASVYDPIDTVQYSEAEMRPQFPLQLTGGPMSVFMPTLRPLFSVLWLVA